MDVALRRRFTFEELMPNGGVIRSVLGGRALNPAFVKLVVDVFETLNERIRFLYDRDHQLGHSYFLDVTDIESLRQVFVDRILPDAAGVLLRCMGQDLHCLGLPVPRFR